MARRIDKSRPYAEVYGSSEARYEQFGILFGEDGRELPGYEEVQIPEREVISEQTGGTDPNPALLQENEYLRGQLNRLQGELEDQTAATEEAQGKVDSLQIEVERLNERIAELSRPAEPGQVIQAPAKDAKGSKDKPAQSELDAQLALQEKG